MSLVCIYLLIFNKLFSEQLFLQENYEYLNAYSSLNELTARILH